jgi:hypothetical protein
MRGALLFALFSALVGGGAIAVTLAVAHELSHGWWLVPAAAGTCGVAGLLLGLLGHLVGRQKHETA